MDWSCFVNLWLLLVWFGLRLWGQGQVGSHVSCSLLVLAVLSTMCQASDKKTTTTTTTTTTSKPLTLDRAAAMVVSRSATAGTTRSHLPWLTHVVLLGFTTT